MTKEFSHTGLDMVPSFNLNVNIRYEEERDPSTAEATGLDLVCVLDTSGSMQGEKIQRLKQAMAFVIDSLQPRDRLSIVSFDSEAQVVHGLSKMTDSNKARSKGCVTRDLNADGGTDIYAAMIQGWAVLQSRTTKNPSSCLFLLTDGQDRSQTAQKLDLAREIKTSGTSLLVFGFGEDHDSEHMNAIANAAEGSFTYVEAGDTVVDAFGGAIGTQQGASLKRVRLAMTSSSSGIVIARAHAGFYTANLSADGRSADVLFANLFVGESRDVLLQLQLPAIAEAVEDYPLISATIYLEGDDTIVASEETCSMSRNSSPLPPRDAHVDAQMNRFSVTDTLQTALQLADQGCFEEAQSSIRAAQAKLVESVSYRSSIPLVLALASDLQDALSKTSNMAEYTSGGRAMITESHCSNGCQRSVYTKAGKTPVFQSPSSVTVQRRAYASKSGF